MFHFLLFGEKWIIHIKTSGSPQDHLQKSVSTSKPMNYWQSQIPSEI